jgi:hypothetical protein
MRLGRRDHFRQAVISMRLLKLTRRTRSVPTLLYLFYSTRSHEDAAFLDTLQTLETTSPRFRVSAKS